MITNAELEALRQKAEQAKLLLNSQQEYEAALKEREHEAAQDKLESEISKYSDILDSKSTHFQVNLADASTGLKNIIEQLYTLELEFNKLSQEKDDLLKSANWLGRLKAERGDYDWQLKQLHLVQPDRDFLESCGSDEIKRRFTNGFPLSFNLSNLKLGALGQSLLASKFFTAIGMAIIEQKQQTAEPEAEVIQHSVKQNGAIKPPIDAGDKRTLSQEEFLKLWTSPPR